MIFQKTDGMKTDGLQNFSVEAWHRNKELYDSTLGHPFNQELCKGTLDEKKFRYYVIQDTKFLGEYAKALAAAAARGRNPAQVAYLSNCAAEIAVSEHSFHASFFKSYGINMDEYKDTEMSPACHHYTSFLHSAGQTEFLSVQMAGILPCALIYSKVGQHIKTHAVPDNPFQAWIDEFGSEDFAGSVAKIVSLVDELAKKENQDGLEAMHQAYTMSARLEFMFWDDAYHLRKWPS